MSEYKVTITEKLKRDVYVEANSLEEAQHIATENWYKGDYILDADDFSEINFDAEEVEPQEKIKVVLLQPGKIAKVTEIDSTYEAMKEIVGGGIDVYQLDSRVVIHNRDGKNDGLDYCRAMRDEDGRVVDIIAGTCFVCGTNGDEFISLTEEEAAETKKEFKLPERFYSVGDEINAVRFNPEKDLSR